ncbi:NACHT and WD repeat domain-containing protein 2-like [Synchiropus splendidus]|uniref:NACHT and WD repeat domain-containing protein 2-like n=1 Tax=Synchiropus splendidus TaxID=270530 RepID=UPI00237EB10C|nr:NACHT and WD repeat domain-containing protein 2-like [Synchiropus splendidus]
MHPKSRLSCVKLYLCSNPADSAEERAALRRTVFPKFTEHCKQTLGVDVRVIDPFESSDPSRWPDERRRLQLIQECRQSSAGPFLLALVGHQYGRRGLPAQVPVSEFQLLLQESQSAGVSTRALERVYQRDENTEPPSYCLRRPSHQPDAAGKSEETDEENLTEVFFSAVSRSVANGLLSQQRAKRFTQSALEADLRFALEGRPPDDVIGRCLVYINNVVNANGDRGKKQSSSSLQQEPESPDQLQSLTQLCEDFLRGLVTSCELLVYTTTTECDRRYGYTAARRRSYAESLCQQVYVDLIGLMGHFRHPDLWEEGSTHQQEELCHVLSTSYEITRPEEKEIRAYVMQSDQRLPLVVTGGPCSGKTVLLAHCAQQIKSCFPDQDPVVLTRFSGFMDETSPKNLLIDLCHQVTAQYCGSSDHLTLAEGTGSPAGCWLSFSSHAEVTESLWLLLSSLPSPRQPLVLILDGLDQFGMTFATAVMGGFPSPLPPMVKLIITVSSKHSEAFKTPLQHQAPGSVCLPLGPAERKQCVSMLTTALHRTGRRVTSGQQVLVNQALTSCCLPLYARLLHVLTALWPSDLDVSSSSLPDGVHSSISALLDHLETKHRHSLVSRTVSYLTLSRAGLTEGELYDLLSSDVLVEQQTHSSELPQVDLEMLLLDLKSFVIRRHVAGMQVLTWVSRHFGLVVAKRYFTSEEATETMHSIMADYFSIGWLNPHPAVPELNQDGSRQWEESRSPCHQAVSRKVVDFVYHLQKSDRQALTEALMVSFEFHQALVEAGLLRELVRLIRSHTDSREGAVLAAVLTSSACTLQRAPHNLSTAMETSLLPYLGVLRLRRYVTEICQVTRRRSCLLAVLLSPAPSSVPPIERLLPDAGFSDVAQAAGTENGVVVEVMADGLAWFWTGPDRRLSPVILDCEQTDVKLAGVKSSDRCLLLYTRCNRLFFWDTLAADTFVEVKDAMPSEAGGVTLNTVAGFAACPGSFCVWWRDESFAVVFDSHSESVTHLHCQDTVTCAALPPDGSYVYCGQESGTISIFDMLTTSLVSNCSSTENVGVALIILSASMQEVACVGQTGSVTVWAVETQPPRRVKEIFSESREILHTDYLEDILTLLLCQRNQVALWETCTWEMSDQFMAPPGKAFAQAVLSLDGHLLLALLDSCAVVLVWQVATGECVLSLDSSDRPVKLLRTLSDIICVTADGSLSVWDSEMISAAGAAPRMRSAVKDVVVERLGQWFYTSDGSEAVWRWTLKSGRPQDSFLHDNPVEKVRLSLSGAHLVTLSAGEIYIWHTETGQNTWRISGSAASDVLIAPNCKFGVSLSEQGLSHVWKLAHGSVVCSMNLFLSPARITAESTFLVGLRCGDLIAASLWSGMISKRFSCVASSQHVVAFETLTAHPDFVVVMVASGGMYTWKVSEDTLCKHFQLPDMLHCQPDAFQMSSNFALLSTENECILLLDLSESRLLTLKVEGGVQKACLDRAGRFAAYVSEDTTCSQQVRPVLTVVRLVDVQRMGSVVLAKRLSALVWSELPCVFVGFEDGSVAVYTVSDLINKPGFCGHQDRFDRTVNGCPFDRELSRWFPLARANKMWPKYSSDECNPGCHTARDLELLK